MTDDIFLEDLYNSWVNFFQTQPVLTGLKEQTRKGLRSEDLSEIQEISWEVQKYAQSDIALELLNLRAILVLLLIDNPTIDRASNLLNRLLDLKKIENRVHLQDLLLNADYLREENKRSIELALSDSCNFFEIRYFINNLMLSFEESLPVETKIRFVKFLAQPILPQCLELENANNLIHQYLLQDLIAKLSTKEMDQAMMIINSVDDTHYGSVIARHNSIFDLSPKLSILDKISENLDPELVQTRNELKIDFNPIYNTNFRNFKVHIYRARINTNRLRVIVKEYAISNQNEKQKKRLVDYFNKEERILKEVSGKMSLFLKYYGGYREENSTNYHIGIVMEECRETLEDQMIRKQSKDKKYSFPKLISIITSILEGFAYLEKHKIYHLDVKPANIFVGMDGYLKIADFNTSRKLESDEHSSKSLNHMNSFGTFGYLPPEIQCSFNNPDGKILRYKLNKIDVYGVGMTFLHLYYGRIMHGLNTYEAYEDLKQYISTIEVNWLKHMLRKMLHVDPRKRPKFKNLFGFLPNLQTSVEDIE